MWQWNTGWKPQQFVEESMDTVPYSCLETMLWSNYTIVFFLFFFAIWTKLHKLYLQWWVVCGKWIYNSVFCNTTSNCISHIHAHTQNWIKTYNTLFTVNAYVIEKELSTLCKNLHTKDLVTTCSTILLVEKENH